MAVSVGVGGGVVGDGVGRRSDYGRWLVWRLHRRSVATMVLYLGGASAADVMCGDWHRSAVVNCPFWLSGYCHKSGANRPVVALLFGVGGGTRRRVASAYCVGGLLVGVLRRRVARWRIASEGCSSAYCV